MAKRSVCPKCCSINRIGDSGKLTRCPKCKNFYCPVCKTCNIVGSVDKIKCLNLNCNRTYERSEVEKKLLQQNKDNDLVFLKKDHFDGNLHEKGNEENNQNESFCSKIPQIYGIEERNNDITISNYVDKNIDLKMPRLTQEQQSDTPIDNIDNIIEEEDIIQISRSEVELRWYEVYKQNFEKQYLILFEKLDIILDNLIKSHRFPLYLNEISPKYAKKYLSIYKYQNPETSECFMRDYVTRTLVGDRFFKKILDKKAYGAIIYRWRFLNKSRGSRYYLGVTSEKEEIRFAQHIADSIIRYLEKRTMTKKAKVIIQALKTHGLTEADFSYYYSQIRDKKFYMIGGAVMPLVKECENLFEREILEIHKSITTAVHKEKLYTKGFIDGINYKIDGLNEIHGGGGGIGLDLPMYDVGMMITFGFEYKTIKDNLLRFYDIEVSVR